MGASTTERLTPQQDFKPIPDFLVVPVAASTTIFQGVMVGIALSGAALGNALGAANVAGPQLIIGRAEGPGDTGLEGTVANTGANGALSVRVKQGVFKWANGTAGDAITQNNVGFPCYASDDHTVNLTDGGGTRPFAGIIQQVDSDGVWVQQGNFVGGLGNLAAMVEELDQGVAPPFKARAVATSALAAYTRTLGSIQENSNGALGSVFDGVTVAVNDVIFLPEGIAAAAADAGPWQITSLGGASAKFTMVRPSWYADGNLITQGMVIELGAEGTVFGGTSWKSFVAQSKVIDTDAPLFWPGRVVVQVTLSSGTFTINTVPIRSITKTCVIPEKNASGGTVTSTVGYYSTSAGANGLTAGSFGTGQVIVQAIVAAGTVNAADNSVLNVVIINW